MNERIDPLTDLMIILNAIVLKYRLLAGWEVRIVKNCDRGLENAAQGRKPRAAFSRPRSQFFTIRTDPKPANLFFFPHSFKSIFNSFTSTRANTPRFANGNKLTDVVMRNFFILICFEKKDFVFQLFCLIVQ